MKYWILLKIILIALLILSLFMNVVLCISTLSLKKELTNWEKYDNSAFETLYFAGEGESTIEDIDAPPGTYSIKCNWEGDGRIVLYDGVDSIGQLVAYGNEKTGLFEGVMISGHIEVKVEGMWTVSIEKID